MATSSQLGFAQLGDAQLGAVEVGGGGPPVYSHTPTGGLALGGSATVSHVGGATVHTPAGGVALGGTATVAHLAQNEHNPTGGIALGGEAGEVARLFVEGLLAVEVMLHTRDVAATAYAVEFTLHTRTVRDLVNGDGVVMVHARAIRDADAWSLFSEDVQRPRAAGVLVLP